MSTKKPIDTEPRKDIHQIRRDVHDARGRYYSKLVSVEAKDGGGFDTPGPLEGCEAEHNALAVHLIRYWDRLHNFKNEDSVAKFWRDHNLDVIGKWAKETISVEKSSPGWGRGTETVEVSRIKHVAPSKLINKTHDLDDVAHRLGFEASPTDPEPGEFKV